MHRSPVGRDAEILRLYRDEGHNAAEIGRAYGITRERVRQIIAGQGQPGYLKVLEEDRAKMAGRLITLFNDGTSYKEIAVALDREIYEINATIRAARNAVSIGHGTQVQKDLVIAADGRSAIVRKKAALLKEPLKRDIMRILDATRIPMRQIATRAGLYVAQVYSYRRDPGPVPGPKVLARLVKIFPELRKYLNA